MAVDMLSKRGLTRNIIIFALPLMASGVVQQSFNSVDVAMVGRYVNHMAVASVGSNGPVIGLIVNLFIGIAIGANVVIANFLGQRNEANTRRAVATTACLSLIGGALLLLIAQTTAKPILELLGTPPEVMPGAVEYLRIYTLGFPFMLIYNFGSAVLRSVGDTRQPFYWLAAGCVVNLILDFVFVAYCGMGISGVATATVMANVVCAGGIVYSLTRRDDWVRVEVRKMRMYGMPLKRILQIGVPAGVQGVVFSLSNVFIQSSINSFGPEAMAGSAAALNFEIYCYFIVSAFVQAAVAFISQNYGAGNKEMCRMVYLRCLCLTIGVCAFLNVVLWLMHDPCIRIFTDDPQAMYFATERMRVVLLYQWIAGSYEISGGALRALGYSMTPTVIVIIGTCVVRVAWVSAVHFDSFAELLIVYPITWIITGISVVAAYHIVARRRLRIITAR